MGCLFACFGVCKHRKRRHLANVTHFEAHRHEASGDLQVTEFTKKQEENEHPIALSREKLDETIICTNRKKVTFDLDVTTNEESLVDNLVKDNEKEEIGKKEEEQTLKATKLVSDSISSSVVSHVPNNRYQNCTTSEDESEDLGLEESDLDDDSGGADHLGSNEKVLVQEESSESLFSLSIDSRKHVCDVEMGEKEVNSPMPIRSLPIQKVEEIGLSGNARDRSQYVWSVLNPVENITQWKVVKARATPPLSKHQEKENINLMEEIAVNTSLSSWLVESETTPISKTSTISVGNSPSQDANKFRGCEDKPILAALAVEEFKQLSSSSPSSRRSRSQSPDKPVIGTVGSYWSCTGKIMDSDSSSFSQGMSEDRSRNKEDKRVHWDSIPFEARLERALNTGIAEV